MIRNLTFIPKGQSQNLKGCALFLMAFLHSFNQMPNLQTALCLC